MTDKDLHPGLEGGALRELLAKWRRGQENTRGMDFASSIVKRFADELETALSLSSPIEPPTEMRICEINHLVLHPNQTYRFTVDVNCKECVAYVNAQPTPQASSEVREAGDVISNLLAYAQNRKCHRFNPNCAICIAYRDAELFVERVRALAAPSRQGAGGK